MPMPRDWIQQIICTKVKIKFRVINYDQSESELKIF